MSCSVCNKAMLTEWPHVHQPEAEAAPAPSERGYQPGDGVAVALAWENSALRDALDGLVRALLNPTPQPGSLGRALLTARAALARDKGDVTK